MNNKIYRKRKGVKELDKCYLCNNKAQLKCKTCKCPMCNDCSSKARTSERSDGSLSLINKDRCYKCDIINIKE